jgi:hypothetical protein
LTTQHGFSIPLMDRRRAPKVIIDSGYTDFVA